MCAHTCIDGLYAHAQATTYTCVYIRTVCRILTHTYSRSHMHVRWLVHEHSWMYTRTRPLLIAHSCTPTCAPTLLHSHSCKHTRARMLAHVRLCTHTWARLLLFILIFRFFFVFQHLLKSFTHLCLLNSFVHSLWYVVIVGIMFSFWTC